MTMLPRNMTSPSVSPSAGTALSWSRDPSRSGPRAPRSARPGACSWRRARRRSSSSQSPCHSLTIAGPVGLGQPVEVGDVEARVRHGGEHGLPAAARRRLNELDLREQRRFSSACALSSVAMTIGAPHRCVTLCSAIASYIGLGAHPAQADVRAGDERQRPGKAPAVAVEHRQRPQIDRMLRHAGRERVGVAHQRARRDGGRRRPSDCRSCPRCS